MAAVDQPVLDQPSGSGPAAPRKIDLFGLLRTAFMPPDIVHARWTRSPAVYLALLVAGTALALFRLPVPSWGILWTEDGGVFLEQAYRFPLPEALLHGYAGYAHLVPRLVAAFTAAVFPLVAVPVATTVIMAVLTAVLALGVFHLSSAHIRNGGLRILIWLLLAAAPLAGLEILLSTANFQWYLMVGAFWAVFARRDDGRSTVIACLIVVAAVGSSALALLYLPFLVIRVIAFRARKDILLLVAGGVMGLFQLWVMVHSQRTPANGLTGLSAYIKTFLVNVVGLGWFGPGPTIRLGAHVPPLVFYVVTTLLLLGMVAVGVAARRSRPVVLLTILLSAVYYVPVMFVTGYALDQPFQWILILVGTRYFFFPSTMIAIALLGIADFLLLSKGGPRRWSAIAIVVVQLGSIGVNYAGPDTRAIHLAGPSWSTKLSQAREACRVDPSGQVYLRGDDGSRYDWDTIVISCAVLRDH